MTVTIHQSAKFHHAQVQYFAEAGGHTLLRLTCGSQGGKPGGAIKTATVSDFSAAPICHDRKKIIAVMCLGVKDLGARLQDVSIEIDSKGRHFGEIKLEGSQDELIEALRELTKKMLAHLVLSSESAPETGYSELHNLYNDLCVLEV